MIVARVRRTLRERALIEPGMRVLAACSGGPDSAAMLAALARLRSELGFELEAASVDHGLRAGSAKDVALARDQAARQGVRFHPLQVEVARAGSLQANARAARYAALQGLSAQIGAERIAVGHTRDDQAETVLMRLLRGASVAGLAGIEPRRPDGVIRPLLDCRRVDAAGYAAQRFPGGLAADPGNRDPSFERVRVRNRVLPVLLAEDPALVDHLAGLADDARAQLSALSPAADALLEAARQADDTIDVSTLTAEPEAIRRLALRRWLERATGQEVGRSHLVQLERARERPVEVWLPEGWVVQAAQGRLRLSRSRL